MVKPLVLQDRANAMVLCCLSSVPQPATQIARDAGVTIEDVAAAIREARKNGWPVGGSSVKGYTMDIPIAHAKGGIAELERFWNMSME